MSETLAGLIFNGTERLFILAIGLFAIVLGYRLFLAIPDKAKGEGKLQLPGGISIFVTRVGPGVFFALFGAATIAWSSYQVLKVERRTATITADGTRIAEELSVSGLGQGPGAVASGPPKAQAAISDDIDLRLIVRGLNMTGKELETIHQGAALEDRLRTLRDAKLALMHSAWRSDWGDYAEFEKWVLQSPGGEPPGNVSRPAAFFLLTGQ